MIAPDSIALAYKTYYTQIVNIGKGSTAKKLYSMAMQGLVANVLGYPAKNMLARVLGWLLWLNPVRSELAKAKVMYLPYVPGGKILDVGCGNGEFLRYMKDFGWNVAGVDFDPVAVEVAVSQGLEVALGSIKEQAYPEACFDAVVMSHLLEHVHDPFTVMNECFRILRPGGRVVVTTPNSAGAGLKQFGAAWRGLEQPRHLQIFTGAALGTLAKRSGFRKVDIWTSTRIARVIYLASTETAKAMQSGNSSRQLVIPLATPSTELYHFREILRSLWDRNAGDELIMICTK